LVHDGRVWTINGKLTALPVDDRPDLLAAPVADALRALDPTDRNRCAVVEIDPDLADTAAFCDAYDSPLSASANCVVVAGKRDGQQRYAACLVLATTRADVNGTVRRRWTTRWRAPAWRTAASRRSVCRPAGRC
jgi:hypothetical protein